MRAGGRLVANTAVCLSGDPVNFANKIANQIAQLGFLPQASEHLRRDQLCHHRKTILTAPRSGATADRACPLTIVARARITAQITSTAYKCSFFTKSLHSSLAPSIN